MKTNNLYGKLVRFAVVGLANTLLDFIIYFSLTRGAGMVGILAVAAKGISFLAATAFSFFANRRFTFGRKDRAPWSEFLKFYLTIGSGVILNAGTLYIFHIILGVSDLIAFILATVASSIWSFSFSEFWVFRRE